MIVLNIFNTMLISFQLSYESVMCSLEFKADEKSKEATKTDDKIMRKAPVVFIDADDLIQELLYVFYNFQYM